MDDPWWFWFLRPFAELAGSLALILVVVVFLAIVFGCVVLYDWVWSPRAKRGRR